MNKLKLSIRITTFLFQRETWTKVKIQNHQKQNLVPIDRAHFYATCSHLNGSKYRLLPFLFNIPSPKYI